MLIVGVRDLVSLSQWHYNPSKNNRQHYEIYVLVVFAMPG
jgi:hypothetical protein